MGSKVSVVKLPKSGGVSQRQSQARQAARSDRIFEYFHGPDRTLHPVTHTIEPEKLRVFRLGEWWLVGSVQCSCGRGVRGRGVCTSCAASAGFSACMGPLV